MYKVSIIIPIYNVEKYIETSLLSALEQTFQSIEFILIDDCGQDNSLKVVQHVLDKHPRRKDVFIYSHSTNQGLSAARNTGLSKARGKYVFFMDSDDIIVHDCIELHYNAITRQEADFSVAEIKLEGARSIHIKPIPMEIEKESPCLSYFQQKWNVSACNKLYRKDFLNNHRILFEKGIVHEDVLWNYWVSTQAARLSVVNKPTYIYKVHANSITTKKNDKRRIESLLFILHSMKEDVTRLNLAEEESKSFDKLLHFWCLNTAILLVNFNGTVSEAHDYYRQVQGVSTGRSSTLLGSVLKLPFTVFRWTVGTLYKIYKNIH